LQQFHSLEYTQEIGMVFAVKKSAANRGRPSRTRLFGLRRATPIYFTPTELDALEREHAAGMTSTEILALLAARGFKLSEATFRKYVQRGLLPRSRRVGRKGMHRGSCGLYPPEVVRRIDLIKRALSQGVSIDEVQRSVIRFQNEIHALETSLGALMAGLEQELREAPSEVVAPRQREALARRLLEAKREAAALMGRIGVLERELATYLGTAQAPRGVVARR
jgi:DNA-binding transcriptional MerR regulator